MSDLLQRNFEICKLWKKSIPIVRKDLFSVVAEAFCVYIVVYLCKSARKLVFAGKVPIFVSLEYCQEEVIFDLYLQVQGN